MEVEEAPRQRSNTSPSSPEFEFWMVRNPSFPPSNLLTADELFLDGVLLPLQLLSLPSTERRAQPPSSPPTAPPAEPSPSPSSILLSSSSTSSSLSKRWKDLFKAAPEKKSGEKDHEKNLRKKDRRSSADLNINLNIWPFTRSQSAGGRPRSIGSVSGRKVSSAPCSRSNSRGESGGGRRWAASPGRGGVHLARSSPVWQIRRTGAGPKEKGKMWTQTSVSSAGSGVPTGVRVLNLNVNSCIGYGEKVSSRGDDSDGIAAGERIVEGSGANGSVTSVFSLRSLFSKKVY
ncbi:hypothetical protein KFK09_005536 [Dendrobium nobile]|uniref:Uncharacterized protein n=1 Tax=Dendrobium nobile TaxID=94219 RepID=A0A8T3C1K7_DENNO|nr:hypothetical protein KFK09_005536 [Dendrobium nobile]